MEKRRKKPLIVVSSGIADDEFQAEISHNSISEFDVQKTAESEFLYPAIAQGYPVSGFKDIKKNKEIK